MSRGYRVRLPNVTAVQTATAQDHIELHIDMLPILSGDEMTALLRDTLEAAGWRREGDALVKSSEGSEIRLGPDGRTITLRARGAKEISARGVSKSEAKARAAQEAEAATAEIGRALAKRLERAEIDLRAELEQVLQEIYASALKQKAASMGEIESVEDGADGELTIKIRV